MVVVLSSSDGFFDHRSSDRIVYQGYVYHDAEIMADFGKVLVDLWPSSNINEENGVLEYSSPYTLYFNVASQPGRVNGVFVDGLVADIFVKNVQVTSLVGSILYESSGGQMQSTSGFVRSWASEPKALDFERQEVRVYFSMEVHAEGNIYQESFQSSLAPEAYLIRSGDLTGGTP